MFSRLNWLVLPPWLTLSVAALILANYLGAGEYRSATLQGLMAGHTGVLSCCTW